MVSEVTAPPRPVNGYCVRHVERAPIPSRSCARSQPVITETSLEAAGRRDARRRAARPLPRPRRQPPAAVRVPRLHRPPHRRSARPHLGRHRPRPGLVRVHRQLNRHRELAPLKTPASRREVVLAPALVQAAPRTLARHALTRPRPTSSSRNTHRPRPRLPRRRRRLPRHPQARRHHRPGTAHAPLAPPRLRLAPHRQASTSSTSPANSATPTPPSPSGSTPTSTPAPTTPPPHAPRSTPATPPSPSPPASC